MVKRCLDIDHIFPFFAGTVARWHVLLTRNPPRDSGMRECFAHRGIGTMLLASLDVLVLGIPCAVFCIKADGGS